MKSNHCPKTNPCTNSNPCTKYASKWFNCELCNEDHWNTCIDHAFIYTKKKSYTNFSKVPIEDFERVCEVKHLRSGVVDKFNEFYDFDKISKFINLSVLSLVNSNLRNIFANDDHFKVFFPKKIANFQKLSYIIFTNGFGKNISITKGNSSISSVYNDKMLIVLRFDDKKNVYPIPIIPPNIKYLNVISDFNYDFTNLPSTIEYLNLSVERRQADNIKQTNLPIGLKTLNIIVYDLLSSYRYGRADNEEHDVKCKKILEKNCKIPFDCALSIEFIKIRV
jgi:hypothetical protein